MKYHNNVDEIILFINNDERSYKSLIKYISAIKANRALSSICGVVRASILRYRKSIDSNLKLNCVDVMEAAKRLIEEYKKEIELGNY